MRASASTSSRQGTALSRSWWLRGLAAAALAVSAVVHADLATGPWFATGQITLAGLFVADAVASAAAALWVLVQGSRLAWLAVAVVAVSSTLALLVGTYVRIPSVGPFPVVYEPAWYAEKVVTALATAVASVCAVVALAAGARRR